MARFIITDTVSGEILEGTKARKFLQSLSKPPRRTIKRRSAALISREDFRLSLQLGAVAGLGLCITLIFT